ncbi:MAG: phosphoglucosamine mutase [Chitinophagales bacterium]
MTLIKSISGIRGTIGGKTGDNLTPVDIVKFTAAYGTWLKRETGAKKIVLGRDGRISGPMVQNLVIGTLQGLGLDVVNIDLSTTPTVEVAVIHEKADGGIILTASHNPKQWNALKLLDAQGEFISGEAGAEVLKLAEKEDFDFVEVEKLGKVKSNTEYIKKHIELILNLPYIDVEAIKAANFKIVVDGINSTGGTAIPQLLSALGVKDIHELNCEVNGIFQHNPEPLPENLSGLSNEVKQSKADLGIAVDPDVDRLCFVCEDGEMFGEEYTIVSIADFVLKQKKGNTVSNLSSSRALKDITLKNGGEYFASAVGEVNVVAMMKAKNAIIGGEGNGGVILPELHYGRDALVGIALFLTQLAKFGKSISVLRSKYPNYHLSKNKIQLEEGIDIDAIFELIVKKYKNYPVNSIDGVKIEFDENWVHLRKSNTEPVVRIYSESSSENTAESIARQIMVDIKEFAQESVK